MFAFTKLMQAMVASGSVSDPQFYLTTLLLNTSSTNGAQNNTFLDSSGNGNHPTRNGNVTQGTFTPFSQTGWSIYNAAVSATDYYCQLNNSDYSLSTGDFTIEFWMFVASDKAATCFASAASNPNLTVAMNGGSAGARQPYLEYGGSGTSFTAFSNYLNTWTHVAFVRNSGTVTVYQNGVALSSASKSAAVGDTANLKLLRNSGDSGQDFPGYISNFRISKSAVYTSTFTPSTTNLTTTSQGATSCQLLTFQNNRFIDNSSNAATVTPTNTAVQAFSPFAPTAAYDAAVVGGSGYFDGTGDYLTTPSSSAFNLSSGDWTIEGWFWLNTNSDDTRLFTVVNSSTDMYGAFVRSGTVRLGKIGLSDAAFTTINLNSWNHIAFCKTSTSTITCYINGVSGGNTTTYTFPNADCTVYVAASPANYALSSTNGYISNFRVVKGTAVYTANFTPPTAPLTAITNTSLLLSATNSGIFDSTAKNVLETISDAQVSTTVAKWGTTSMYFDGTDDSLSIPSTLLNLSSGDFTVEAWVYATTTARDVIIGSIKDADGTGSWMVMLNDSGQVRFFCRYGGGTVLDYNVGSGTFATNSWKHIAVTRNGANLRIFVDGTQVGTTNTTLGSSSIDNASTNYYVGRATDNTAYFTGYIDDLRITKGYARYTANFTPPAAAFPLQ